MKPYLFTLIASLFCTTLNLIAETDSCSPLKDSIQESKPTFNAVDSESPLDQSIVEFLKKEGLLNPDGIHPFESEPIDYPDSFIKDDQGERTYREMLKQNKLREQIMEHNKDMKHLEKQSHLKPILLSTSK